MRKWLVALMIVLSVALGGTVVGIFFMADRKGPEISFAGDKKTVYSSDMTDEELLEGVTAKDNEDGDVSNSLRVEGVFTKEENQVYVSFVAKDRSNNVTKRQFAMESDEKDDKKEKKEETEKEDSEESEKAESEETEEEGSDTEKVEELTPAEEAAKREQEKIDAMAPGAPKFYLTTYYLEIPVGTPVDQLSYVSDIQDDVDATNTLYRQIQIEGSVDSGVPGTYELTYYVVDSSGNESNRAVLTIVVQ